MTHSHSSIEANFIPGSKRPVPVVVIARNWQTGVLESWVLSEVRPSYSRTFDDLSHMGLRRASWVTPLGSIASALFAVYACGLLLSVRLSQRIVVFIEELSHSAIQVGKGDFSVRVPVPNQDQMGILSSSFNEMTRDLQHLREQETQSALLERDMALAKEVQEYLYPRIAPALSGASVCGITTPARIVSGDLYDLLPYSETKVGLLCADVSGKGVSAALMMAHLQALVRGRLAAFGETSARPAPDAFIAGINRDLEVQFGANNYVTMFYGEYDSSSKVLRYVNAGHCPPILISATGQAVRLLDGDLPVGLFPDITYNELQVTLSAGCAIVAYTDGVTDALNTRGEEFGEDRLMSCCMSLPPEAKAEEICAILSRTTGEWAEGVDQFDDTSIVVLAVS